jgi:hypothetical protein
VDGREGRGAVTSAVHERVGLTEVRLRGGEVHRETPRHEQHEEVEGLVQVALHRERHRHHGHCGFVLSLSRFECGEEGRLRTVSVVVQAALFFHGEGSGTSK